MKLRDIISDIKSGDWGKDSLSDNYTEAVYCIRGADIPNINNGEKRILPSRFIKEKSAKTKVLSSNNLVVEISGGSPTQSTGRIAFISNDLLSYYDKRIICSNFCKVIIPKNINPEYLYYYWKDLYNKGILFSYENGTTGIKNLDLNSFINEQDIWVPDPHTQQKIVQILKSLDNKIELNRRINANLEAQAQALFRSWFVDFEPFRDGPFVDSELGKIPQGWEIGTLSEIADITMGQSPKGSSYNEEGNGIIFYQGRAEFGNRFPSIRLYTTEPTRIAEINSVLLSVRAPVGDINIAKNTCCIGRGLAAIKSKHGCNSFILYLLQSLKPLLEQYNGEGTVFGCINRKEIEGLPIIIPKESVINEFEEIVEKIDSEIKNLTIEQENLSALRDTLLPKLMAGEINVE